MIFSTTDKRYNRDSYYIASLTGEIFIQKGKFMRNIYSLCDNWQFVSNGGTIDPALSFSNADAQTVQIPHCWNIIDGRKGETYYRGCTAYQRILEVPADAGSCFFLEFEGANAVCRAYLNGIFLGEHRGGYSTFRFDITDLCSPGGQDLLTVFVDNSEFTDVNPTTGDFTIWGGLYRPVRLISVPATHFDLMHHGTAGILLAPQVDTDGSGLLEIEPHIIHSDTFRLCYDIISPNGQTALHFESDSASPASLHISNPILWNGKEAPELYTFHAHLTDADGNQDDLSIKFGFRSFSVDSKQGFFLNHRRMPLHGVAQHQDRADCGNAISVSDMEKDFSIIREIGANALRLSHYQHAQHFYDLCDETGLIVWAEIPMLSMEADNDGLIQNARQQLTELILQNQHHPSICFWGIQNEIAIAGEDLKMYHQVEQLHNLARHLDPNRLTTSANLYCVKNQSPLNQITDVVAYNLYYGWYYGEMPEYAQFLDQFHSDNPTVSIGISEYGVDANPRFHSDTPHRKDYSEEYQSLFHETVYPILENRPFVWGTFVWNLFDFGSALRNEGDTRGLNCKGLVSYDRSLRKDAFYYYKARWSDKPFVHINSRRYYDRAAESITVRIYSNCTSVELIVNGSVFSEQTGQYVFEFPNVPLTSGLNTIVARSKTAEDSVNWNRVETPNAAYTYSDPNPGYNVQNWFTLGETEQDLFPEDRYSLMDSLDDLMKNPEAFALMQEFLPQLFGNQKLMKAKSFTLFKIVNRMSGSFDEEIVQELNNRLRQIKK